MNLLVPLADKRLTSPFRIAGLVLAISPLVLWLHVAMVDTGLPRQKPAHNPLLRV